jgi:flagellar basal body-associated protein FliL
MDEKNANQTSPASCCLENTQPNCCESSANKKQRSKLIIFIIIMLAAVGVGAYSILVGSKEMERNPTAADNLGPQDIAPKPAESCCPSQQEAQASPPACGNQTAQPCCTGE